ncbi:hypothetical protein FGW37_26765 [Streptomyces rectiverticillatus]|uniref:hypothetical protein n=1 Tax=Streptomyces rectiverticillatus TaxID=173860 RepID=UPI0015C359FF|nr:hypothetical protein [Streptomyces rectiverticillatus]QLE74709.1 hypothetical protein FGW37_26765 [Streptomyces rectiverticillatus]
MNDIRTTPPRPADVATVFPQLAPLARPATRLHPRPGSPSPHDSSVGGPLLWPADEPWPYCEDESHGALADEWNEGPVAMVPVVQLYVRDVPLLRPPGQADLLQVLWCPFEHEPDYKPPTALFWRSAAEVTDILAAPPEPSAVEYDGYVPEPCVVAPEQITEYPNYLDLRRELQQQLDDRSRWQAAGVDNHYALAPHEFYWCELSVAPGWKVGGWPPWGLTDPVARFCAACGVGMVPLLTVASGEWDSSNHGWVPYEDQHLAALGTGDVANPPAVQVSRGNHLQLYVCPESPDHPHTDLIQ